MTLRTRLEQSTKTESGNLEIVAQAWSNRAFLSKEDAPGPVASMYHREPG
jgi:hypothetical protein